jgi:23S rRNA pseudouridine955/2504/2580 synthase
LVQLIPETGRTHQLRVHCATGLKAPILGDRKYGQADGIAPFATVIRKSLISRKLFLHAFILSFKHPFTHKWITTKAPLPPHMKGLIKALGFTATPK